MKPEGKGGSQKKETIKIDLSKVEIEPLYEELVGKTAIAIVNLPPRKMMFSVY
jgi:tRNA-binding EMAP/Myf-like protein